MLGSHRGWVPSPAEPLASLLQDCGFGARTASSALNPYLRAAHIAASLVRWRRAIDVAVVLVYSGRSFAVADLASRLTSTLGVPLVLWLHGGNLPELVKRRPDPVRRVICRAERLVAPSPFLAREFRHLQVPVSIIPNPLAIDAYPFRVRSRIRPRILWMRTFGEVYRPELALRVFARALAEHPNARLTMAGQDRGLRDRAEALAAELGISRAVVFPGFLQERAKLEALAEHDLFLNTTRVDNMPVALLEAAACGLPIVSTSAGGIPDVFKDGREALLTPTDNEEELADSIGRLVRDPALSRQLATAARCVALTCGAERVCEQWAELLCSRRRVTR